MFSTAIVTGVNGTVAPVVATHLRQAGYRVVAWDRRQVPPEDEGACLRFIDQEAPAMLFHLAVGSPDWAALLARACAERGIRFLYTSSVSVFAHTQRGPFTPTSTPEPNDDYGRYKLVCEQRIQAANPDALIARLGWQIGERPGSNNMVDYLYRMGLEEGQIKASTAWYPSCAFLKDTAASLLLLMERYGPGLYHLEGNPGLSLYEIAVHLQRLQGWGWEVMPVEAPVQHNLMLDERLDVAPITRWFE